MIVGISFKCTAVAPPPFLFFLFSFGSSPWVQFLTSAKTHVDTHGSGLVRCCSGDDPQPANPIENDHTVTLSHTESSQIRLRLASEVWEKERVFIFFVCRPHTRQTKKQRINVKTFFFFFTFRLCRIWVSTQKAVQCWSTVCSDLPLGLTTAEVIRSVI